MPEKKYIDIDVLVIGAGPAGLAAALYASRANLKTMILEMGMPGGEVNNTTHVENYLGFTKIDGPELSQSFLESATAFGAEQVYGQVDKIEVQDLTKYVYVGDTIYRAPVVIIATGAYNRLLDVPGEEDLTGRGVSYCAICDGFFFRNKELVVVGGGDSAVEEGAYLTEFADKVTIIHRRDELRAQQILQDRAFDNDKVEFIWDTIVESINGDDGVTSVSLKNVKTNATSELEADGVFIYVGLVPRSEIVKDLGVTNEEGWILTNEKMETNIPGLFAVGDVREKFLRQIATAVGDGTIAGHHAYDYLQSIKDVKKQAEKSLEDQIDNL